MWVNTQGSQGLYFLLAMVFAAKYDLNDFKVSYLKKLLRSPMLDFCATNLIYLETLILFHQSNRQ